MNSLARFSAVTLLIAAAWGSWKMHFWTPPGRAFAIQNWKMRGYEFQAWQRKNDQVLEPFTTGLFVRKPGESWQFYQLDFEDIYRPNVILRDSGNEVGVYVGKRLLGTFDLGHGTYRRVGQREPISEGTTENPGNWPISP